jgi:hypothetical protein
VSRAAHLHLVDENEPTVRLVNVRELAAAIGCSEREAYRVGSRLPHYRVGRMLRWNLDEALDALREEPTP